MACPACARLERIARGADPEFVTTLSECQVVLADEQLYRGYCILFLRDHAEHLADLSFERQQRVWDDVARVAVNCIRIEIPVWTEGFDATLPKDYDMSAFEDPVVMSDATLWMARQPLSYTGNIVEIGQLRAQGVVRPFTAARRS